MIDHLEIQVKDLMRSKDFYQKTLEPLGYQLAFENDEVISFLAPDSPHPGGDFWIGIGKSQPIHLAFLAQTGDAVDRFHQAGMQAGARDNGAPGYRESYHPPYYAAFLLDPDGNNIEAVCHK